MLRPIRAGALRHRGTFLDERQIDDGHGGQRLQWEVVYRDVPIEIEPLSGNEAVVARQLQDTVTHKVRLRYLPGITARMEIQVNGRAFRIREVRNIDERNRALELRCEEGAAMSRQRPALVQPASPNDALIAEWDFTNGSLAPNFGGATPTFTRAGNTATRVNASGLIEVVNADLPRFDYDPVTLAIKGLLIEEARTNVLLRSAEFDNASWVKGDTTVTPNSIASPDGGTNGDKLIEAATSATHLMEQSATLTDNVVYTGGFFLKAAERTTAHIRLITKAGTAVSADFNLSNGTITAGVGVITAYGNGWYRCTVSADILSGGTSPRLRLSPNSGSSYVGDGTSGIYVWGAQLEPGSFPTFHIPTTTASVTRNADVATLATSLIAGFSASTLTMFVEGYAPANIPSADFRQIVQLDSAGSVLHYIGRSASVSARAFTIDTTTQASLNLGTWADNTIGKAAYAAAANDFAGVLNGGTVQTDSAGTMPALTTLRLGANFSSPSWNGHIRKLRLYNRRLTNGELQAMTA